MNDEDFLELDFNDNFEEEDEDDFEDAEESELLMEEKAYREKMDELHEYYENPMNFY